MKNQLLSICIVVITLLFTGCSKDAEDAANSNGSFSASDINGSWKETKTGVVVYISGVSSYGSGSGKLTNCGTAFPAGALNGIVMKQVEHQAGGYWDAYNQSYYNNAWYQGNVIGLAMNDAKTQFKIGTAIYVKQ